MAEEIVELVFGGEPLLPDRGSYKLGIAFGAIVTDIGNGPVRSRANGLNNSVNVSCTYTLDTVMTQWFMDLWYSVLKEGQMPLKARLDLTGSDLTDETWYVTTIIGASLPQYTGLINKITVQYNAVPLIGRELSASRALVYEAFGYDVPWALENMSGLLDSFARFLE